MNATIEYLWWADCPSHEEGYQLLQTALAAEGLAATIHSIEVTSEAGAERLAFIGSPTIRVQGVDIDPDPVPNGAAKAYALTCRIYTREDGRVAPLPSLALLRQRLRALLSEHISHLAEEDTV